MDANSDQAPKNRPDAPIPREPSTVDALIPIGALIALLSISFYLFRGDASSGPNQIALIFCGLIAAAIAYKNGHPWERIRQAAVDAIATGVGAIGILLAVGALIGAWALSGTIVTMVYYGLQILNPNYFYATTALICALVALSIGSSWTTAGTIGIGLMGIAGSMNLSLPITAGAVISGAYFGDKASPFSDSVNLATAAAGSEIFSHIRESFWSSVPAMLLALAAFWLLGSPSEFDASTALSAISKHVEVSAWNLLPLGFVLILAILRFPPMAAIFLGALCGVVLAAIQHPSAVIAFAKDPALAQPLALIKGGWSALATGYRGETGDPAIDQILTRGGMSSMMVTVWLIVCALGFGGVVEHGGFMSKLINPLVKRAQSVGALVSVLVATCVGANAITSDQYIAIVLPGRLFKAEFQRRGLAPVFLSRVIGDSAVVTSPLIPWNSCGAFMAATLGLPVQAFLPFCFFCLLNPIVSVVFSFLGLRVIRSRDGSE